MDEGFATNRDYVVGTFSVAWAGPGSAAAGRIVVVDGILVDWDAPSFPPDVLVVTLDVAGQFIYTSTLPTTSVAGSFFQPFPGGIPDVDNQGNIEAGMNVSAFWGNPGTMIRLSVWWHYRRSNG